MDAEFIIRNGSNSSVEEQGRTPAFLDQGDAHSKTDCMGREEDAV